LAVKLSRKEKNGSERNLNSEGKERFQ
jgi:hypothetical protein